MAEEGCMENHEPLLTPFCLEVTHTSFVYISLAQVSHMAMTKLKEVGRERNGDIGEYW